MIYEISKLPKVGDKLYSTDNPTCEKEYLECVGHIQDDELPEIVYALFKSVDDENLNTNIEGNIKFYRMFGYM